MYFKNITVVSHLDKSTVLWCHSVSQLSCTIGSLCFVVQTGRCKASSFLSLLHHSCPSISQLLFVGRKIKNGQEMISILSLGANCSRSCHWIMVRGDYQIRLYTVHLAIRLAEWTLKFEQTAGVACVAFKVQEYVVFFKYSYVTLNPLCSVAFFKAKCSIEWRVICKY